MSVYRLSLVLEYTNNEDLRNSLTELYDEIISQSTVEGHNPNMMGDLLQYKCTVDFQVDRDETREQVKSVSLYNLFEEWLKERGSVYKIEVLQPFYPPNYKPLFDFIETEEGQVRHRGFGGRERSIYYLEDNSYLTDNHVIITGKRTVKTGTYYPPYSGYSYEGEYDYESGGLTDEKTHILLSFWGGEIESTNVELVKRFRSLT